MSEKPEICRTCKYSEWVNKHSGWGGVWMLTCLKYQMEVMVLSRCESWLDKEEETDDNVKADAAAD